MPVLSSADNGSVVIVGAGHAGGAVAALLRQHGFAGPITLLGAETIAPYQRPPLSKAWLKGEANAEGLALRPESFYGDHGIDLKLGIRARSIDLAARCVVTEGGDRLCYGYLILATGALSRSVALSGAPVDTVLQLRSAADADRLKAALKPGAQLAVVGGGYIGLEVAAVARSLGVDVLVIEREPRLLARVACNVLSDFFHEHHRSHGVRFALGQSVERAFATNGALRGVRLSSGEDVAVDAILMGIGATPDERLAQEAGLACADGIVVDQRARTSNEHVYAIGDCTRRPLPPYGRMVRLESVPNVLEQARQAAADICGTAAPAPEAPWFWSDQYKVKLQIAGLPFDVATSIVRGTPDGGHFAIFHLDAQLRVQAVEAVNAAAEFMAGKLLIASRRPVAPPKLRDLSTPMKEVAA